VFIVCDHFTFIGIHEIKEDNFNLQKIYVGQQVTFRRIVGGESVDFKCIIASTEIVETVKDSLVSHFLSFFVSH